MSREAWLLENLMEITLNPEQRLFVIPCGDGYSCAGFDYVFKNLKTLAQKLLKFGIEIAPAREDEIGTPTQYEQYCAALQLVGNRDLGTWFDPDTPKKARTLLEQYRKSRAKVRVFYGDTKTGRDWMEEYDMVGHIGRSGGSMKIPLLISEGEHGGLGLLDSCIVRMIDVETRKEVYCHPRYHLPEMEIRPLDGDLAAKGYTYGVWATNKDGAMENHANFRSYGLAAQWVAFMSGFCMEQPQ